MYDIGVVVGGVVGAGVALVADVFAVVVVAALTTVIAMATNKTPVASSDVILYNQLRSLSNTTENAS